MRCPGQLNTFSVKNSPNALANKPIIKYKAQSKIMPKWRKSVESGHIELRLEKWSATMDVLGTVFGEFFPLLGQTNGQF
jgi:hypothetical protein